MDQWSFPANMWPNITIFRQSLMLHLDIRKMVEADDGYAAESPWVTKTTGACLTWKTQEDNALQLRVQGRHKTVNTWFKRFEILNQTFWYHTTWVCL